MTLRKIGSTPAPTFTPTKFHSADEKATYVARFKMFVTRDFPRHLWTKWMYQRTSGMWGHIAHYNIHGFWEEWFSTTEAQVKFLEHILTSPAYGSPEFTWVDVETYIRIWLLENSGILATLRVKVGAQYRAAELATLATLKAKYEGEGT